MNVFKIFQEINMVLLMQMEGNVLFVYDCGVVLVRASYLHGLVLHSFVFFFSAEE